MKLGKDALAAAAVLSIICFSTDALSERGQIPREVDLLEPSELSLKALLTSSDEYGEHEVEMEEQYLVVLRWVVWVREPTFKTAVVKRYPLLLIEMEWILTESREDSVAKKGYDF
ncbi:hypothetical protein BTVI_88703 [Pitangus sulphuratus]|nr:hypothetical protein BTVI_88703 [Pitangus sulphuratus]